MAGRVFVTTNRKGGTGKTTESTNLAVYLSTQGKVIFIDADPKQSDGFAFFEGREIKYPDFPKIPHYAIEDPDQLERAVRTATEMGADVVIDCAPLDPPNVLRAIELADVLIYPFQAGGNDMRAVGRALSMAAAKQHRAEQLGEVATRPKLFSIINKFKPRHNNDKALMKVLQGSGVFHYLGGVPERLELRDSAPMCLAAWEYAPEGLGSKELFAICEQIHRNTK